MKIKLLLHQDFPRSELKIIRSFLRDHPSSATELPAFPGTKLHTLHVDPESNYGTEELVALLQDIDKSISKLDDSYKIFFSGMDAEFALQRNSYDLSLADGSRHEFTSLDEVLDRYRAFCREKTMILCPFIVSDGGIKTKKLGEGYWLLELKENRPQGRSKMALGLVVQDVKAHADDTLLRSLDQCIELFFLYFFLHLRKDIEPEDLMFAKVKIKDSDIEFQSPFQESDDLFLDDCHGYKDAVDYTFKNDQYTVTAKEMDRLPANNNIYKFSPLVAATRRHYGYQSPLCIAMTSFNAAYTSEIWHDEIRLIMLTTALEALFSISNSELRYRLSSNIAWFLRPEPQEYLKRKSIMTRVSKIYDFRSDVIHGTRLKGIPEIGAKEEKDYIDDALSLFREVILHAANNEDLRYFETVTSKKHFIEMLQVGHRP